MAQVVSAPGLIRTRGLAAPSLPWPQRLRRFVVSPQFLWGVAGLTVFLVVWYLLVDVLRIWNFARLPSAVKSVTEWLNPSPVYGFSIFTKNYYIHVWASVQRVLIAFILATALGVTVGLLMGWRRMFFGLTFPVLELLRPIPILAYIPVVLLLVPGREAPIIVLTFLAAFFVTVLNTLLGVQSIDQVYFRAARSLGFSDEDILLHVIVPGALPYIFIGLQIGMAACWFSLVASEIVSGQSGMGYQVWQTYYYQQYETMVIFMVTLGFLGWVSSALVRAIGNRLMRWRSQMLEGI